MNPLRMATMIRLLRGLMLPAGLLGVIAHLASVASTQPLPAPVTGSCHVSPIVEDLERSAHFYHDLLGLELPQAATSGPTAWVTDRGLLQLHGLAGGRLRFLAPRIAGQRCGVELVEFGGVDRRPVHRRYQDPGAVTLVFVVRDIETAFAPLAKAGVPVVSTGGAPIMMTTTSKTRAVTVKDPDGNFIELAQLDPPPQTNVPASSNIIELRLRVTVPNLDRAAETYRSTLGIEGPIGQFAPGPTVMRMVGLPEAGEARWTIAKIPGSGQLLEFIEFRGVGLAAAIRSRIQDPGSTRLQLTVRDVQASLGTLGGAGFRPISTGGTVGMTFGGQSWRLAAVEDPNNLFLVLQQPPMER
jgi:catechol 2,3-dioxygenase-like lactoylglutathione lyase family enzyme